MADLPGVVRTYLDHVLPADTALPQCVRISQEGRMRFKQGGRWMPFTATQEYDTREVAFTWRARFRVAPLVWIAVIDKYKDGVGGLEARLWGAIPAMRASGPDVDKGEALRYLGEIFWTPFSVVANENLHWREASERAAEVTTNVGGDAVSMHLVFDADAFLSGVSTPARPRQVGKDSIDTPWYGRAWEYVSMGGIRLPRRAAVSWDLPGGLFRYWEGRVTDVAWS